MTPRTYYNENDPFAAHWLYNLIQQNLIAPGDIDTRDIRDVRPTDLKPYAQCHFFAGIGVWSLALRNAGWRDDRPIWTGSCPCQPFSAAGKGGGFADERHLWPAFHHLIRECRPAVVVGEQVASKDGLSWLDLVQSDMEGTDYAFGAVDTCAAGFGAPYIRQRLYWCATNEWGAAGHNAAVKWREYDQPHRIGELAYAARERECADEPGRDRGNGQQLARAESRRDGRHDGTIGELGHIITAGLQERIGDAGISGGTRRDDAGQAAIGAGVHAGELADAADARQQWWRASETGVAGTPPRIEPERLRNVGELADADGGHPQTERLQRSWQHGLGTQDAGACDEPARPSPTNGHWSHCDWLLCRDGKWRPVEPGTFPLAHGASSRVGRLRAYGNAIVAEQAQAFIEAAFGAIRDTLQR